MTPEGFYFFWFCSDIIYTSYCPRGPPVFMNPFPKLICESYGTILHCNHCSGSWYSHRSLWQLHLLLLSGNTLGWVVDLYAQSASLPIENHSPTIEGFPTALTLPSRGHLGTSGSILSHLKGWRWRGNGTSIQQVEARGTANLPLCTGQPPQQRHAKPSVSVLPRMRNFVPWESCSSTISCRPDLSTQHQGWARDLSLARWGTPPHRTFSRGYWKKCSLFLYEIKT